jgi:2-haloacid dehalogenase
MTEPKVIAFDLFGTVFDLAEVPREEVRAYIDHISRPEWAPLTLPESWERLRPFRGAGSGLAILARKFAVVTCSNAPLGFTSRLLKNADLPFDAIVPLEANRVFKPNPRAYLTVCEVMRVEPSEVLMVTANPRLGRLDYGDVEAAREVGMRSVLIESGDGPTAIVSLAEDLGA